MPVYRGEPGYLASASVERGVVHALQGHLADAVARICEAVGRPQAALERLAPLPGALRGALVAVHRPENLAQAEPA